MDKYIHTCTYARLGTFQSAFQESNSLCLDNVPPVGTLGKDLSCALPCVITPEPSFSGLLFLSLDRSYVTSKKNNNFLTINRMVLPSAIPGKKVFFLFQFMNHNFIVKLRNSRSIFSTRLTNNKFKISPANLFRKPNQISFVMYPGRQSVLPGSSIVSLLPNTYRGTRYGGKCSLTRGLSFTLETGILGQALRKLSKNGSHAYTYILKACKKICFQIALRGLFSYGLIS